VGAACRAHRSAFAPKDRLLLGLYQDCGGDLGQIFAQHPARTVVPRYCDDNPDAQDEYCLDPLDVMHGKWSPPLPS
jgi:hypothetical protein